MRDKIFLDTVHGSIHIPNSYCKLIIDTLLFQRLRRVEQSSIRSLYPCARHDRFIHSIGVFHIGSMLIERLEYNMENMDSELFKELKYSEYWKKVTESYKIACLLHDIGHTPFSHTFERYFDIDQPSILEDKLCEVVVSEEFKQDLEIMSPAAQHEMVSAYLLASQYNDAVEQLGGDVEQGVRMIIGCNYNDADTLEKQFVNCLIKVLHGDVDADRLDYAVRDQWAAGFTTSRIHIGRILRSITIIKEKQTGILTLCFTKNAISQIECLTQIKDFQNKWVFCHQNIIYDQYILTKAIEEVASIYGKKEAIKQEDALRIIFNFKCFLDPDYQIENQSLYLLSDDTILQMFRQTFNDNDYAREWMSRQYRKRPIWKTPTEYKSLFNSNLGSLSNKKIKDKMQRLRLEEEKDYTIVEAEDYNKRCSFLPGAVKILINDALLDFNDIIPPQSNDKQYKMFYIYLDNSIYDSKKDIVLEELRKIR